MILDDTRHNPQSIQYQTSFPPYDVSILSAYVQRTAVPWPFFGVAKIGLHCIYNLSSNTASRDRTRDSFRAPFAVGPALPEIYSYLSSSSRSGARSDKRYTGMSRTRGQRRTLHVLNWVYLCESGKSRGWTSTGVAQLLKWEGEGGWVVDSRGLVLHRVQHSRAYLR
jgi:hypothetical protein